MNVVIYILQLVASDWWPIPYEHIMAFANRRARALHPIRLSCLPSTMLDRGKVVQLRDRITTNCLPAFPQIRRTRLAMLILHPPCVSATYHI